jgi:hypothetical protein
MLDAYAHTPVGTLLGNRLANLGVLVTPAGASARQVEFLHVFFGLGLLNLGWLGLLRPVRRRLAALDGDLLGGALVSLLVWCLAMFGPATTAIHNGSYLTMLMLAVGLAAVAGTLWSVSRQPEPAPTPSQGDGRLARFIVGPSLAIRRDYSGTRR